MSNPEIEEVLRTLAKTVCELEYSVMQAYEQFLAKYGVGHEYSNRLESYFPAIDKQHLFITEMDDLAKKGDFEAVLNKAAKIRALSEMIKEDARSFLTTMNTGVSPEKVQGDPIH